MIVTVAEANYFNTYALFYVGGILGAVGFIAMGKAMFGRTAFLGKRYAWVTVIVGILFALGTLDIAYSAASNPVRRTPSSSYSRCCSGFG